MDAAALAALRLDLTNQGMCMADSLIQAGFGLDLALDGRSGAAEGVDLILPGHCWVNVCVAPGYARTSPYTLALIEPADARVRGEPAFHLTHRTAGTIPVTLPATARFRHARIPGGISCGDIGAIHGPWLVTAPFAPNSTLGLDRPRRFLGLPPQRPLTKSRWSVDEIVACAETAWELGGARLIHLEAGHLLADDGGLADLVPYIQALKRALPTLVSVSALPPTDPALILELYAAGADALAYHLLAWDAAAAARVAPVRERFIGHQRLLAGLQAAARFFPIGGVSTDLLVGLEPLTSLPAAIDTLAAQGIVPNLALFRPLPGAEGDAPHGDLIATELLVQVMAHRRRQLQQHGLWHSRIRGFPRALAGIATYAPGAGDRWYAGLRRWLRVQRPEAA